MIGERGAGQRSGLGSQAKREREFEPVQKEQKGQCETELRC